MGQEKTDLWVIAVSHSMPTSSSYKHKNSLFRRIINVSIKCAISKFQLIFSMNCNRKKNLYDPCVLAEYRLFWFYMYQFKEEY